MTFSPFGRQRDEAYDVHRNPHPGEGLIPRTQEHPMTQTPVSPPSPDDIVLEDEGLTQRLDRDADALIAEGEARASEGVSSVRQAVRDDAAHLRDKVSDRVERVRDDIREEPLRTTFYALGIGVVLGMLLRR